MFQVLEVISFRPLRSKVKNALVTAWFGEYGICDRLIYFDKTCLESCVEPQIGSKVFFIYKLFISYFLVDLVYKFVCRTDQYKSQGYLKICAWFLCVFL